MSSSAYFWEIKSLLSLLEVKIHWLDFHVKLFLFVQLLQYLLIISSLCGFIWVLRNFDKSSRSRTWRWDVLPTEVGIDRKIVSSFRRQLEFWSREESVRAEKWKWWDLEYICWLETYVLQHFVKITFGIAPRSGGITEEDEVGNNSSWIDRDHLAHATECRVLLLVVANISQWRAPEF